MKGKKSELTGHLDIIIIDNQDDEEGKITEKREVLIHGDPEGLKSLARLLIHLAEMNQETMHNLPVGAREHFHLRPNIELSKSSFEVIVGRLDAKGTGSFYPRYISKD
ncbi:hypothetical protein [Siphonobacter sp. SORGH_AS_0500]|uniref:Imm32 family immunity protein n=1 Tax=Siphonobacter sp. SORGH_AS_0500 TaxID=1864824 RepID=UPI00285FADA2|nr:hypothetical protein [Siphonobacter sp. SORGH_AS_0500]MDR6193466.1 hypothetical protein [Siphonobacter sp. SORGH_AS_0500]